MKRSDIWFEKRAVQDARANFSNFVVLQQLGPNNLSEPNRDKNSKGEKYFIAGKSVVGEEEVVG